jgi:mono/diheme cytochrome c family protein
MRRSLKTVAALLLTLGATGCDYYYNGVPSPDDLMHVVPWFDAMIKSPAVHPYETAAVPRNTVPGTVPITGGEADWSAEWGVGNTTTADKLVNPLAGQPASARGDTLYHTFCAVCHGDTGNADSPVSAKVAALPLTTPRAIAWSDGYLYSIIRYGRGVMPRYAAQVRGINRWEIVNYVRKLQADATAAAAAPAPAGGVN